jgi:hypothetical protein
LDAFSPKQNWVPLDWTHRASCDALGRIEVSPQILNLSTGGWLAQRAHPQMAHDLFVYASALTAYGFFICYGTVRLAKSKILVQMSISLFFKIVW